MYAVQVSLPKSRVLYTAILVFVVRLVFSHTLVGSLSYVSGNYPDWSKRFCLHYLTLFRPGGGGGVGADSSRSDFGR